MYIGSRWLLTPPVTYTMKNFLKEYCSFSKKERTGIITLLLLILATIALPRFLPDTPVQADRQALEKLQQQLAQPDSMVTAASGRVYPVRYDKRLAESVTEPGGLFVFDPNTLPVDGWKRLGVRERTAITIQHYLAKGGRFRQPNDLYKIYGLLPEEVERLAPYVRIARAPEAGVQSRPANAVVDTPAEGTGRPGNTYKPFVIDINAADTTAFIALPGIGSKLARRIVYFREKLGGFYSVEQIGETYGLPDATFQLIGKWLRCPAPVLRTININTASADLLQQHPYIGWPEATAIVRFREQHGAYGSVNELLQINILSPGLLDKIRPYLDVK